MRQRSVVAFAVLVVVFTALDISGEGRANGKDRPAESTDWWTQPAVGRTKLNRDKSYQVFAYTTLKNLPPSYVPTRRDIAKKFFCALAQDEYESIQIGVHALTGDIKNIQLDVQSDVKVTVYHRVSPAVKEELASLYETGNGIARWMPSEVHLARGNVFEELPAGQSVNFWLTFRADGDTRKGLHRGKIRVKPAGKPATVLDLEVRVRPFQLERPRAAFGVWMREDMLPKRFGGVSAPKELVLAIYRDMAEHGHNSNFFYPAGGFKELPPKNHVFDKLIPLAHQAGLLDPNVPSLICGGIPGGVYGEQLKAAVSWLRAECRKRGWPEMIVFGDDEPKYPLDDDSVRKSLAPLRNVPIRVNLDQSSVAGAYGYMTPGLAHIHNVMDGIISPEMMAEAKRVGAETWTYSYRIWREDCLPFRQRYFAGLYTWTHKLRGNWVWAYHHGHHRHAWFAPDSQEPMPLTAFEARREGIDDYRYLQMVEDCVAANPDKALAVEAAKWLKALRVRLAATVPNKVVEHKPLALGEYDEIRAKAAGYIEKLGPVPKEAVIRPPRTRLKDEAASYRGKSVEACMTGLANSEVSKRRAAAWALFEMGSKAVPATEALAQLLDDPEVRMPALHALEAIGPEAYQAVPDIARLLTHPDFYVRVGANLTLGAMGCPLDKRDRSGRRSPSQHAAIVIKPLTVAFQDDFAELALDAAGMLSVMGPLAKPALPAAITMLDHPSPTHRSAALGLIICLGPDAAPAVPKLIKMLDNKFGETRYINALAAIGPAASAAIPALGKYAAKKDPGPTQADSYYALFCIRGEISDLRRMVILFRDPEASGNTRTRVVKLLNQLGAKAGPVADEVRRMLRSKEFSKWAEDLQVFLEKVKKGETPRSQFEW